MGVDVRSDTGLAPLAVPGEWTSVGDRLHHVARARPSALALAAPDGSLTYAELMATVVPWARALRALPGDEPLALDVTPSVRCPAALLAIVLSGRPAIPLDPQLPAARVEQIVAAAGARRLDVDTIASLPSGPDLPSLTLDDPAVIFFTSGSTGRPKGVVHSHAAWLNQAYGSLVAMDMTPADRHALVLPLSFGGGLDVLFMSLLNGASAHVYDPRVLGLTGMLTWLREQRVTGLHVTPSMLRSILEAPEAPDLLRGAKIVSTCGEAIHSSLVTRLRGHLAADAAYFGWSGASEIGTLAYFPLPCSAPVPGGIIPVGTPAPNKHVEVVDDAGDPVPPGVTGEVVITSRYLASGYVNDPAQTATRFRRNADGTSTYRGGDLGRWDDDGNLHLRGRADAAVKVGGYLVEPAEVEAALLDSPDVKEAVVTAVARLDATGVPRPTLVAHVVPVTRERSTTPASVRRALRSRLPSWMVPATVVLMTALPRNERGKVDRPALPAAPDRQPVPPATPTERLLAEIWQNVLGLTSVPANADFWELGADSLAVEEMITAVRQATGLALGSTELTRAPTIAELAALVEGHGSSGPALPATAVTLRAGAAGPAVFAFAGGGAAALSLLPLATALRTDVSAIGFQASGYESRGLPDWRLPSVVRRHLTVIQRSAPPYVLIGHSFGGLLALETAARLAASGVAVPLVVLLDTILPDDVTAAVRDALPPAAPPPPLRDRLLMHARLAGAGLVRYSPDVRNAVFWEQSLRMINRHRLTTWAGRTLVFKAEDNPDDPQWWDRVLTGPHEVIPVAGGHSSILRPPFLRPIVERIDAELASLASEKDPVT